MGGRVSGEWMLHTGSLARGCLRVACGLGVTRSYVRRRSYVRGTSYRVGLLTGYAQLQLQLGAVLPLDPSHQGGHAVSGGLVQRRGRVGERADTARPITGEASTVTESSRMQPIVSQLE
jgi:hypothetical protein